MGTRGEKGERKAGPPPGFEDHLSRREAATMLGFASDFKVRQLEKAGRLRAVHGEMGQAWYPRSQVMLLAGGGPAAPTLPSSSVGGRRSRGRSRGVAAPAIGGWSDAALIAHLRGGPDVLGVAPDPKSAPTVVDLVADTGVSIARAERVYRFWLAHDRHPLATQVRAARGGDHSTPVSAKTGARNATKASGPLDGSFDGTSPVASTERPETSSPAAGATERRANGRLQRDALIRQLRDPDPAVRGTAFKRLQQLRTSRPAVREK
jgi:hypothetical protein